MFFFKDCKDPKFITRTFVKNKLVRYHHNVSDVIGDFLTEYEYNDNGNLIDYAYTRSLNGTIQEDRSYSISHEYQNDLLVMSTSPYDVTNRFYDDQNRLFKVQKIGANSERIDLNYYTSRLQNTGDRFSVYPNSVRNILDINPSFDDLKNLKIYDSRGHIILELESTLGHIDLSEIYEGVYILKGTKRGKAYTTRFIKV